MGGSVDPGEANHRGAKGDRVKAPVHNSCTEVRRWHHLGNPTNRSRLLIDIGARHLPVLDWARRGLPRAWGHYLARHAAQPLPLIVAPDRVVDLDVEDEAAEVLFLPGADAAEAGSLVDAGDGRLALLG